MTALDADLAAVIAAAGGFIQGSIGLGFAIVGVPLLTLVNPAFTPVPVILTSIPLTLAMAWRERDHIEWRRASWVLLGRLPGALLGLWLLRTASERSLSLVIAIVVLGVVVALGSGMRVRRSPTVDFAGGVTSGMIMGQASFTLGVSTVKVEGNDIVNMLKPTAQNGVSANAPVGLVVAPGQVKVLVSG